MVGPDHLSEFVAGLDVTGIEHSVMVEDAQVLANQHKMVPAGQRTRSGKADHDMDWEDYHPIEDMYSYLQYLEGVKNNQKLAREAIIYILSCSRVQKKVCPLITLNVMVRLRKFKQFWNQRVKWRVP
jgi:hypothetical protein